MNGVPLTRRRDHWHTGSLVSMALVALVGSGDSELTGDKLLFMAKAQGPAERQEAPSSWLGNKVSQSVCSWRVLGLVVLKETRPLLRVCKGAPLGLRVCRPPRQGFSKVYPNWDATGMHPGCRIGEWLHIGGHFRGMTRGCKGRGMGCGCSSRVSIEAGIVEVLGYANTGVCTKEAAHFPASKNRFPPSVAVPPAWTAPSP